MLTPAGRCKDLQIPERRVHAYNDRLYVLAPLVSALLTIQPNILPEPSSRYFVFLLKEINDLRQLRVETVGWVTLQFTLKQCQCFSCVSPKSLK